LIRFERETEPKGLTLTDGKMALVELIEQASDGDLIREMLAFAASRERWPPFLRQGVKL